MAWTAPAIQTTNTHITAAIWNAQITDNMTFLGVSHNHSGDAGDGAAVYNIPSGAISIFDAACPAGWTRVSAFDGKFIRGAASYGGTGGADTHTHTIASLAAHTHAIASHTHGFGTTGLNSTTDSLYTGSGINLVQAHPHTGSGAGGANTGTLGAASPTAAAGSSLPVYITVIFCKKD